MTFLHNKDERASKVFGFSNKTKLTCFIKEKITSLVKNVTRILTLMFEKLSHWSNSQRIYLCFLYHREWGLVTYNNIFSHIGVFCSLLIWQGFPFATSNGQEENWIVDLVMWPGSRKLIIVCHKYNKQNPNFCIYGWILKSI